MKRSTYIKPSSVVITLQMEGPILAASGLGDGQQVSPGLNSGLGEGEQGNPGPGKSAPWQSDEEF